MCGPENSDQCACGSVLGWRRSTGCWHRSRRSDCAQVRHYVISVAGSTLLDAAGEPIRFRWQAILQALVPAHTLLPTLTLASALGYQAPYYVFSGSARCVVVSLPTAAGDPIRSRWEVSFQALMPAHTPLLTGTFLRFLSSGTLLRFRISARCVVVSLHTATDYAVRSCGHNICGQE